MKTFIATFAAIICAAIVILGYLNWQTSRAARAAEAKQAEETAEKKKLLEAKERQAQEAIAAKSAGCIKAIQEGSKDLSGLTPEAARSAGNFAQKYIDLFTELRNAALDPSPDREKEILILSKIRAVGIEARANSREVYAHKSERDGELLQAFQTHLETILAMTCAGMPVL